MSLALSFDADARAEFDEAADWYNLHRPGLGFEFVDAINAELVRIAQSPRMFGTIGKGIRRVNVKRFPFCVIYREEPHRVLVLAVLHTSRDESVWQVRS